MRFDDVIEQWGRLSQQEQNDWLRRYQWIRSADRTFGEWDAMRTLHGITLDAYIDQKMGYDDAH
jgi:hypothetical protein